MEFQKIVEQVIAEEMTSGGEGSSFGPNVGSTAGAFSGDNYAPGDARNLHGLYGGVLTRSGMRKKKRSKKRRKKKN
jgi:hypothetical protein